jgi:hypothetical protein
MRFFGWGSNDVPLDELPEIFPLAFKRERFIEIDVTNIYAKVLTDVVERIHGLTDEQVAVLFDNCVQSEASKGLISLLAHAMAFRQELFLVYSKALNVLRKATGPEVEQIRADYKKAGKSSVGVFISFSHYYKSELVALYSALEYCTLASLHKSMNLSVALQLKMSELRSGVSLTDSADVKSQAQTIAKALGKGQDILLDAKDTVETAVPDLTAIKESIEYIESKRSFYLGLPASYINGEQTGGLGTTGENDTKAIERGLKNYYISIIKPVLDVLFETKLAYKSQDFRQIDQALNALKTFALTDDTLVSAENKLLIMNQLLDLPLDAKGDAPPKETPLTNGNVNVPPKQIPANGGKAALQ